MNLRTNESITMMYAYAYTIHTLGRTGNVHEKGKSMLTPESKLTKALLDGSSINLHWYTA